MGEQLTKEQKSLVAVRLAVVCHDLGKVTTTTPELRSPGHASAGEAPTRSLLKRLGAPSWAADKVVPLVREHMFRVGEVEITPKSVRRLARRLDPATVSELVAVMRADHAGRPPLNPHCATADRLEVMAAELQVANEAPKALVGGRHLLAEGLCKPGPEMGVLLKALFERQLNGEFNTVEEGLVVAKEVVQQ